MKNSDKSEYIYSAYRAAFTGKGDNSYLFINVKNFKVKVNNNNSSKCPTIGSISEKLHCTILNLKNYPMQEVFLIFHQIIIMLLINLKC